MPNLFLPPLLIVPFVAVIGLIIGSFLNVVIHRGPRIWKLSDDDSRIGDLLGPRSYCPECHTQISIRHLAPIASYAALGGKCANCAAPISVRYPIVEFLGGAAALVAYFAFGPSWSAFFAALFFWSLIALAVIDLETGFLPDAITLPLLVIGLAVNIAGIFAPLGSALIGAIGGYAVFWLISYVFKKFRNVDGLGGGDAKLLAALGAWLGWPMLAPLVFVAAILALAGAGLSLIRGASITRSTEIAFGPYLATAGAALIIAEAYFPIVP